MERQVFDRMAELDSSHWWYVARREILAALIERAIRLPKDATILEIGCGTGHNLDMLGRFGRIDAIELDEEARGLASRRLGRPVLDGRLPDIADTIEERYDLVTLLDVLEHIPDDRAALSCIPQLLRPGGRLLLTVPANPWMWSAHDAVHHHHRRYSKRDLSRLLRGAGLRIDLLSYFNSLLFPPVAAVRLIGQLRGSTDSDDRMPSSMVNSTLRAIFASERHLVGRLPLPFGVSLVAVVSEAA